jgi:TBC domain-containing protein kinase-like protein
MTCVLGEGKFGAFTFYAREHGLNECDNHGLPLTPNTIIIIGSFQKLLTLSHPNICHYLDLIKCDDERVICVSEYYTETLEMRLNQKTSFTHSSIIQLTKDITGGLAYLHDKGIIASFLSPESILFTTEGRAKLFNYGLHHMTGKGSAVDFSLNSPRYISPEVLLSKSVGVDEGVAMTTKSNVWSLGIILLEVFMENHIYPDLFLKNGLKTLFTCLIRHVQTQQRGGVSPLMGLIETHGLVNKPMDEPLRDYLEQCLQSLPSQRPSAQSLTTHPLLKPLRDDTTGQLKYASLRDPFQSIKCDYDKFEPFQPINSSMTLSEASAIMAEDHLKSCSLEEVYFLWSLAGGDLKNELHKAGLIRKDPPILTFPSGMTNTNETLGGRKGIIHLYDNVVIELPLDQLNKRLMSKSTDDYYPIVADPEEKKSDRTSIVRSNEQLLTLSKLPLLIKEKDIDYQFHRLIYYRRLLEGYPYTRDIILTEAIVDVCPLVRGPTWAALLDIQGDIQSLYDEIDKDTVTPTDRQISVDIPRCHQYDLLLASKEGHRKFLRILKAWVVDHPDLVYWQGLDSLCAPFLSLNFSNEALAYSSLCAFIDKYLHGFFLKDNAKIMQEYLAVFAQMIAYHSPEIFNHLDSTSFNPDLYAIPWFLTMFTHVFPLHKIYHLWDTLLLGDASFPLFAGISILLQLKSELLNSGFNDCIMMFSDLPDIDIDQCVSEAVIHYQTTPPSLCYRLYDNRKTQSPWIPVEADKVPLPLEKLQNECSPQISAHDMITLCKLKTNTFCYKDLAPPPTRDPDNLLLWRQMDESNQFNKNVLIVDIRSREEYPMTSHYII